MGFKRYLFWNDAIYGLANYWISINSIISTNCFVVTNITLWQLNI